MNPTTIVAIVALVFAAMTFLLSCAAYYYAVSADSRSASTQAGNDQILRRIVGHDFKYGPIPDKVEMIERTVTAMADRYGELLEDRERIWDQMAVTDKTVVANAVWLHKHHQIVHHPKFSPN